LDDLGRSFYSNGIFSAHSDECILSSCLKLERERERERDSERVRDGEAEQTFSRTAMPRNAVNNRRPLAASSITAAAGRIMDSRQCIMQLIEVNKY